MSYLFLMEQPGKSSDRFGANSDGYARFRPAYPGDMVRRLAGQIVSVPAPPGLPVVDVGCGTGIFTRQLAAALPVGFGVLGVEPSERMRAAALGQSEGLPVRYAAGTAEALPVAAAGARAVTAATAAHWFDRPRFYAEAARVLVPGGVLGIVEYIRDAEHSPAAAAVEDFLRREGGPQVYRRPDYADELGALAPFELADVLTQTVVLDLDPDGFAGLALSSSHARAIAERRGEAAIRTELARIGAGLAGPGGRIAYGYRFQSFVARRRPAPGAPSAG